MRFPLRFLVPALAFALLVGFFVIGLQRDPGRIPSPLVGKPAPDFSLESLGDPAWKVGTADFASNQFLGGLASPPDAAKDEAGLPGGFRFKDAAAVD